MNNRLHVGTPVVRLLMHKNSDSSFSPVTNRAPNSSPTAPPTAEQQAHEDSADLMITEIQSPETTARRLGKRHARDAAWTAAYEGALVARCRVVLDRWQDEAEDYREWLQS